MAKRRREAVRSPGRPSDALAARGSAGRRGIAPDLDAIPVGIPEIHGLSVPTRSPAPTRPVLELHAVLGEMLLEALEVAGLHHHGEVVQVLEAGAPSQHLPGLHGKEVDHGVPADAYGGKPDF